MNAFKEKKLKYSTADTAFITRDYQNWKDATISFRNHESSACHKQAVTVMITIPATHGYIGECLSSILAVEKRVNRECFMKLISSIRFLAPFHPGLTDLTIHLWHCLPSLLVNAPSTDSFKGGLKLLLPTI